MDLQSLPLYQSSSSKLPVSFQSSTLLRIPSDLAAVREKVFCLGEPVVWSGQQFEDYWEFMDNFWVHNKTTSITTIGQQTSYYYCRLWKDPAEKSEGQGHRAKKIRTVESCSMKLKMIKKFSGERLTEVVLNRHQGRGKNACLEHNHQLEYIDMIKINSAVRSTAATEVSKGYAPCDVNRNLQGVKWTSNKEVLKKAGGTHLNLKGVHNAGADWKKTNPDDRLKGNSVGWMQQQLECVDALNALPIEQNVLSRMISVERKEPQGRSYAVVFAKQSRLQVLTRRGYLSLMDATHNVDALDWHLFTIVIRTEYNSYLPCAHMVSSNEDGDIIAEFLRTIKTWCGGRGGWQPRYFLTDDSAAEQRAVKLAFRGLIDGEMEVDHLLCRTHSERTLNRRLTGDACKQARSHLYAALYFRKTSMGCEESIEAAIKTAPNQKIRKYIENEWWQTRKQWAYYARQHSCLLLQIMTTNIVESWHHSIKQHAGGKGAMMKFSLQGTVVHVLAIAEQWQQRADKAEELWRKTKVPECLQFRELEMFPGPVQTLIVDQMHKANAATEEGEL